MSAKINIAKIRNNVGAKEDFAFDITETDVAVEGWQIADHLSVNGTVTNKDGYLLLEGKIQ